MRLVLPFPPSINSYWRSICVKQRPRVLISKEGREFRERCESFLALNYGELAAELERPVAVRLDIYFPNRRGDLDNRQKVVLDLLQGVAYKNDRQIVALSARRRIDKERPRVEVWVDPVE